MSDNQGSAFIYERTCHQCKKNFAVLRADLWVYKRGEKYFCSWHCLRAWEKGGNDMKGKQPALTQDQKDKAVRLAIKGYSPISFLKACGVSSPGNQWTILKAALKDTNPTLHAQIPRSVKGLPEPPDNLDSLADAMAGMDKAANDFFGQCADMGLHVSAEKEPEPEPDPDTMVSAIRHKKFGEFYLDYDHNCVDWRTPQGDEMSMSIHDWREWYKAFPGFMRQLGVEL